MKELNDEIKETLNLMQTDSDGAREELQFHLYSLLDMKRDVLRMRLVERPWFVKVEDQTSFKTGQTTNEAKPLLTTEELEAGGWWCADVSKECADALESKGLRVLLSDEWGCEGTWDGCVMDDCGSRVTRCFFDFEGLKQIHRIGNDFYWSEK